MSLAQNDTTMKQAWGVIKQLSADERERAEAEAAEKAAVIWWPITGLHKNCYTLILDVPNSMKNFVEFRRRVLEKAHSDITKYTTLRFEWEPIKKWRAVELVRFAFNKEQSSIVHERNNGISKEK